MSIKGKRAITAVIVGAGHRAELYASFALEHPDKLKIVGVADPIKLRRQKIAEIYGLSAEQCFNSAAELAEKGKIADAIINGTMDDQHVATSIPLLEAGYDILLEKPFAVNEAELRLLDETIKRTGCRVMVCHVLRYAPFYVELKKHILNGEIGEIVNIQATEHVSYHHSSIGYVRGKWRNKERCGASMLMAKSCHDLDLITWFKSGIAPLRVASFGGCHFFNSKHAPANSGTYCLIDCPIENDCVYSCKKLYLDHPERWSFYVWHKLEHLKNATLADKEAHLKDKSNPFGRCIWKMDNDVVDRQSVMIEFADGATATLNMVGGCSRPMRKIHIIGTKGELHGIMDESKYQLRHIDPRPGREYTEEEFDLNIDGDMTGAFGGHGGGDGRLVADFVDLLQGAEPSISCTSVADSINGHLIGFAADRAMETHRVIEL